MFEPIEDSHNFEIDEEVYFIDNNRKDIFNAKIQKITKKGFIIALLDYGDDNIKRVMNPKRLLLHTQKNNAIYEEQVRQRKMISSPEHEPIEERQETPELNNNNNISTASKLSNKHGEELNNTNNNITDHSNNIVKVKKEDDDSRYVEVTVELKKEIKKEVVSEEKTREERVDNPNKEEEKKEEYKQVEKDRNEDNQEEAVPESTDSGNLAEKIERNSPENSSEKKAKGRKSKKPVIDQQFIVKTAWEKGIHDVKKFRNYVEKLFQNVIDEFEEFQNMKNVCDKPPFALGGNVDVKKFWSSTKAQWTKLFGDNDKVSTQEFIKKVSSTFKLQNQTESNARQALLFFFDPEAMSETKFVQFCAFLALFGPAQTIFRKIGHFLRCPEAIINEVSYFDVADVLSSDEDTYINEFVLYSGEDDEKSVYNIPTLTTNESYLIDSDGNKYNSWLEFFNKYNQ